MDSLGKDTLENRELERVIRELGQYLQSDSPIDWQESRRWCGDVLNGYLQQCGKSQKLIDLIQGVRFERGGDEHHLFQVEQDASRLYKATYGDNFGCESYFSPADPELIGKHFHGTGNANPFTYLQRWILLNSIDEFQTRFEGFLPPERLGWLPRICVSQPFLRISNPNDEELKQAFDRMNYQKISEAAFIHRETGLLLTDAAPRNVFIDEGIAIPFDALAQIAPLKVRQWITDNHRFIIPE